MHITGEPCSSCEQCNSRAIDDTVESDKKSGYSSDKKIELVKKVVLIGIPYTNKTKLLDGVILDTYPKSKLINRIGARITKGERKIQYKGLDVGIKIMFWELNTGDKFNYFSKIHASHAEGYIIAMENTKDETLEAVSSQVITMENVCVNRPRIFMLSIPELNERNIAGINWRKFERFARRYNTESFVVNYNTGENIGSALDALSMKIIEKDYSLLLKNHSLK